MKTARTAAKVSCSPQSRKTRQSSWKYEFLNFSVIFFQDVILKSSFSKVIYGKHLYISTIQSALTIHNLAHVFPVITFFIFLEVFVLKPFFPQNIVSHLFSLHNKKLPPLTFSPKRKMRKSFCSREMRIWCDCESPLSLCRSPHCQVTQIFWWTWSHLQLCRHVSALCDPHRTKPHQTERQSWDPC